MDSTSRKGRITAYKALGVISRLDQKAFKFRERLTVKVVRRADRDGM